MYSQVPKPDLTPEKEETKTLLSPSYLWYYRWQNNPKKIIPPVTEAELREYTLSFLVKEDYPSLNNLIERFPWLLDRALLLALLRMGASEEFRRLAQRVGLFPEASLFTQLRSLPVPLDEQYAVLAIEGKNDPELVAALAAWALRNSRGPKSTYEKLMRVALFEGQEEAVKALLALKPRRTGYEDRALRAAAEFGRLDLLERLISEGASDFNQAILFAIRGNQEEVINRLLEYGADNYNQILKEAVKYYPEAVPQILSWGKVTDVEEAWEEALKQGDQDLVEELRPYYGGRTSF